MTNLKRQHTYTENALNTKLKETTKKLRVCEENAEDFSFRLEKLQKDNKVLVIDNAKLEDKVKNTLPIKEHDAMVTHLKVHNKCSKTPICALDNENIRVIHRARLW